MLTFLRLRSQIWKCFIKFSKNILLKVRTLIGKRSQIDLTPNHCHYQLLVDVQQGDLGEELLKTNQSDQIRVTCEGWRA